MLEFFLNETAGFFFGLILGWLLTKAWDYIQHWRHDGWHVVLRRNDETIIKRGVSPGKIMEIFEEPAEMAVFVKGVISPYGRIGRDPLETAGFIERNNEKRQIIINLNADDLFEPAAALL